MAWYSSDFKYRFQITITNSYNTNPVADYQLLLAVNDIPADWRAHFYKNVSLGFKNVILTTSDGVTPIPFVTEDNPTGGYFWAKLPQLNSATTTTIYLYYGHNSSDDHTDLTNVYTNYRAVYHMNSAPTTQLDDATVNDNDGTINGTPDLITGTIGSQYDFASGDYISIPDSASLDITDDLWVQFWIDLDTTGGVSDIIKKGTSFYIWKESGGKIYFVTNGTDLLSSSSLSTGSVSKITCLIKNDTKYIYINDSVDTSQAYSTLLTTNTDPILISSLANPHDGQLDEIQIGTGVYNTTNTASAISAEYNNELNHSTFYSFDAFETYSYLGTGYTVTGGQAARVILGTFYPASIITPIYTGGSADTEFDRKYIWKYRVQITIDATQVTGTTNINGYPLLFDNVLPADVQAHIGTNATSTDFVFTDTDEQTALPHDVEDYDTATGRLRAWIRLPVLPNATNKVLWLYYGNTAVSNTENQLDTWQDYFAVYHLNTDPLAGAPQAKDSTLNGNDMTTTGFVTGDFQTGLIANSYYFDESDNMATNDRNVSFGDWSLVTVEGWHYEPVNNSNVETLFAQSYDDSPLNGGAFFVGTKSDDYRIQIRTESNDYRFKTSGIIVLNQWNQLGFTWNAATDTLYGYANGGLVTTQSVVGNTLYDDLTTKLTIGATMTGEYLTGRADELRIANVERPANYFSTTYNNYTAPSTFLSVGQPEAHWKNEEGGGTLSYVSDPLNDRTIILSYTASGGMTTSGTGYTQQDNIQYYPTGGIIVSYTSSASIDRTIVFEYTPAGTAFTLGSYANLIIDVTYVTVEAPIIVSYTSSAANDRDIILEYKASGIILLSGHTVVDFIEFIFEVTIILITLNYVSNALDDRDIIFEREASGTVFTLGGSAVDNIELVFETFVTPINVSYTSSAADDRTIEFERTSIPDTTTISGANVVDYVDLIFKVDTRAALSLSGGDYYIQFERIMSGGITMGGSVPQADEVTRNVVIILTAIILSGPFYYNEIILNATENAPKLKTAASGIPFQLHYTYEAITYPRLLRFDGTVTADIIPNALFIYEGSGRSLFVQKSTETSFSINVSYQPTGRIRIYKSHTAPTYSYYPIYEYDTSGVALTLLGGEWYTSIRAITPTGGIILSSSDIIADQIIYNYRYTGSGGMFLSGTSPYGTPAFITTISGKTSAKFSGTATRIKVSYIYEYTGSGIIIIRQSSIHRYIGIGTIYTSGVIAIPEKNYTYSYVASGKISFTKIATPIELSKFYYPFIYEPILVSGAILKTKIVVGYIGSGTIHIFDPDSNFTYKSTIHLILRTSGIADYYISDISIIGSGKALLSGSAHYILAEPNTYKSSGIIYTTGTSVYSLNTSNFKYYALGTIYTNGLAYYAKYDKKPAPEFSYVSSGLLTTSGIAVYTKTSVYVSLAAGQLVTTGIADSELHYEYISSGVINISGEADLAYTYLMTGILFISGISLTSATPTYKYTASGFVKFIRIKSIYFRDLELLGRGRSVFSGSAVTIARYIYPDYQAAAIPITLTGQSDYEYTSNYSYESSGSLIITGLSLYEYEAVRFYEAAGQVNIKGDSEFEYSAIYGYSFSGSLISSGIAEIKGGYKEITYIAEGAINTNGTSEDKLRYITLKISNGATAAAFQEKKILKEPLAATTFRYKL